MRFLLLALLGLAWCRAATEAPRPNFLWLIAEDFGPHLGCYGTREVSTPNLDRLAEEGIRFTRFFTTAPVCSPSRSAFMTGMYQTTIGAHNHRAHRDDGYKLPDGVRLVTEWMREAGYFTANIRAMPTNVSFRGTGKTDWNFTPPEKAFDSDKWSDLRTHQPFFAQVNFQETHRAFRAPKHADPGKVEVPPYYPEHPVTRKDWAAYLDRQRAPRESFSASADCCHRSGSHDDQPGRASKTAGNALRAASKLLTARAAHCHSRTACRARAPGRCRRRKRSRCSWPARLAPIHATRCRPSGRAR